MNNIERQIELINLQISELEIRSYSGEVMSRHEINEIHNKLKKLRKDKKKLERKLNND